MDMTKATSSNANESAIPTGTSLLSTTNAGADGQAVSDGDKVGPAHAAIMLATFAVIFPLGAVLLRFLESVKSHYIVQTIGLLAVVIGVGVGIYFSKMYNHVSNAQHSLGSTDFSPHSQRTFHPVTKSSGSFSWFFCSRNGPSDSTTTFASADTKLQRCMAKCIFSPVPPSFWEASSTASRASISAASRGTTFITVRRWV